VHGKGSIASPPVKYQQQAARINQSADKADRFDNNTTTAGTVFLLIVASPIMRRSYVRAQAASGTALSGTYAGDVQNAGTGSHDGPWLLRWSRLRRARFHCEQAKSTEASSS
jgi:hypothetical protein